MHIVAIRLITAASFLCFACEPDDAASRAYEERAKVKHLDPPKWDGDKFENSIGMVFRRIPAAAFRMGADVPLERPVHEVHLTSFWIGAYEVTNLQYERFDPDHKEKRHKKSQADDSPVTAITWCNAVGFCYWLSNIEGVEYRLPTEAEWECAARGGLVGQPYPWGAASPKGRANFSPFSIRRTAPGAGKRFAAADKVGSYAPNEFGLFDMAGNAWEFCWDVADEDYYRVSALKDPRGPGRTFKDELRIVRGGSFGSFAHGDMNARRIPVNAFRFAIEENGFRVVAATAPWQLYQDLPPSKCGDAKRLKYPCYHP